MIPSKNKLIPEYIKGVIQRIEYYTGLVLLVFVINLYFRYTSKLNKLLDIEYGVKI